MGRSQLQNGSQGSDVKYLQQFLNTQGYKLTEDGIFGNNTLAAVKDFQGKNNLTVDGIVGVNTWGAIDRLSAGAGSTGTGTGTAAATTPTFTTSAETDAARAAYDSIQAPTAVDPAYWEAVQMAQRAYTGREKFSFDLNGDALYQQYKDRFIQQGKMAMQDTMGQAAAMTGGYGNSYASTAGNQAYQAHLEGLNDVVPELQQMAYDRYKQEGQELLTAYQMALGEYEAKYGEYSDQMAQYNADRSHAWDVYTGLYGRDYEVHRDGITDEQWQAIYDATYGSGGTSDTGGAGDMSDTGGADNDNPTEQYSAKNVNAFISKMYPESHHDAIARQMYGPYKAYVAVQIAQDTSLSEADKIYLIQHYGITETDLNYARDKGYNI